MDRVNGLWLGVAGAALVVVLAVRASHAPPRIQTDDGIQRIAQGLVPAVERAVGLTFKRPPRVQARSREQVRAYLDHKIAADYPPAEIDAVQRAYRAFGLISDTTDLRSMMVNLYAEQVAGFYEPDSSALFVVRGSDPTMVRLVLAHELVHALQDQYTHLNAILRLHRRNDRQMAGQAVMEGQATVSSFAALAPGGQPPDFERVWASVRSSLRDQQESQPVFAAAPHFLQESLLFPYLAGGEFIQQFDATRLRGTEEPWNERLPVSTEQILHLSKYSTHERPSAIAIARTARDTVIYDDDFGEFESRTTLESWGVPSDVAIAAAAGWNGDRYVLLGTRAGTAVVWASAWDTPQDADEFAAAARQGWERTAQGRAGAADRRWQVDVMTMGRVKVVRFVDAPKAWTGWAHLPAVRLGR
ncbi:MAG: hypothetical protein ACHQU1_03295 [Gemmatimonadales bacterium]